MKKIIGFVIVAVVVLLAVFGLRAGKKLSYEALEKNDGFLEMQLQIVSKDINARLPRMVNEELRLDETRAGPGKHFTSFFTLPHHSVDTLDEQKRQEILEAYTRSTCGSRDLKPLLEAGVSIEHQYRDKDGQDAFSLTLTAQRCAASSIPDGSQ